MAFIKYKWTVDELTNVMTQFTTQKVFRSTVGSPYSWVEITGALTRVDLVAGQERYEFIDTTGDPSYYYTSAYYNPTGPLESTKADAVQGDTVVGADFLILTDLYNKVGERRVIELFDDDNDGNITDASEITAYLQIMGEAESILYSRLLRSYTDKDSIIDLAENDEVLRGHVAWVALELASERRSAFAGREGRGQYVYQYERALAEFDLLSRGRSRSKGEAVAGRSGNVGGTVQPAVPTGAAKFTFADEVGTDGYKRKHGGY